MRRSFCSLTQAEHAGEKKKRKERGFKGSVRNETTDAENGGKSTGEKMSSGKGEGDGIGKRQRQRENLGETRMDEGRGGDGVGKRQTDKGKFGEETGRDEGGRPAATGTQKEPESRFPTECSHALIPFPGFAVPE